MATQRAIGFPLGGYVMRGFWARLTVVGITVVSALALAVPMAVADSRAAPNSTQIGPLIVRVYSLMCDGHGQPLHTRLNIKNTSASPQKVLVVDAFATKITYDPKDVIDPGMSTLVHLTSPRSTPAHDATVVAGAAKGTVPIPKSPCDSTPTTNPTTPPTSGPPDTNPTTATTAPYVPQTVPNGPNGGPPVGSPGIVGAVGAVSDPGTTNAAKAASGTLPFTGSDIRGFALLGDLMVLIGFAMLLISHRSPRVSAFFKRLSPRRLSLGRTA
jgi:hypothetical protein